MLMTPFHGSLAETPSGKVKLDEMLDDTSELSFNISLMKLDTLLFLKLYGMLLLLSILELLGLNVTSQSETKNNVVHAGLSVLLKNSPGDDALLAFLLMTWLLNTLFLVITVDMDAKVVTSLKFKIG
jgi:hypothetical protein